MIINPFRFAGGAPPSGSLNEAILARSPGLYFRHGEASGSVMENESGADGSYVNSPSLGNSALYSGGPTCVLFGGSAPFLTRGEYSGGNPATMNSFSLFCVAKFTSISGMRAIVSRDPSTDRKWQWRTNGSAIEFVKIVGGVDTKSSASGVIGTSVPHTLGVSVAAGGAIKMFVDGAAVFSGAMTPENYGGASTTQIGYVSGGGGLSAAAYFSESAVFYTALPDSDFALFHSLSGI